MNRILHLRTSLFTDAGVTNELAEEYLARIAARYPQSRVTTLDLAANPLPHLDAAEFTAWTVPEDERTPEQARLAARSDALIEQLLAHDTLIIGVPMYNFGIPSTLKAWVDRVVRAGKTFRYTEQGPRGLVEGVSAHLLFARGAEYRGTPLDTQTGHLNAVLGLMGIPVINSVYAEGLQLSAERRTEALAEARNAMQTVAAAA